MKQRQTDDSFVLRSPQRIGTETKPGSDHFYMKDQGAPFLWSAGGFQGWAGRADGESMRSYVEHFAAVRGRFVGNPLAVGVTDDSMGHENLTGEDSGGY